MQLRKLNFDHEVIGLAPFLFFGSPGDVGGGTHFQKTTPRQPGRSLFSRPLSQGSETAAAQ